MSLITLGLGGGGLITYGLGFWSRTFSRFSDWSKKYLWRDQGVKQLFTIDIIGNTSIPFSLIRNILSNVSLPYKEVTNVFGNNSINVNESIDIRGDYKKQFIFETKTFGKKSFMKMLFELVLDDDD